MMKILVTGATGFIGSHLVERLVKEGHEVSALIREAGERENRTEIVGILNKLGVVLCYGDLLDAGSIAKAVKDKDIVFHLAAIARPMAIPQERYFEVNEEGTKNLLEECRKSGVKKVIHMSSVSAVGPTRDGNPVNEESVCMPVDTYGESKLAAERVVLEYTMNLGLHVVMLRPPMVFGPRDLELLKLFRIVKRGFFPIKSGEGYMEFLYVGNLVEACMLALKKGKTGEVYHINNGSSYKIHDVVEAIAKAERVKLSPLKLPNFVFTITGALMQGLGKVFGFKPVFSSNTVSWMRKSYWYIDASKAKRMLGYKPKISLEEGVKRTVKYYEGRGLI